MDIAGVSRSGVSGGAVLVGNRFEGKKPVKLSLTGFFYQAALGEIIRKLLAICAHHVGFTPATWA